MHTIISIDNLIAFSHEIQTNSGLRCWFRGHPKATYKLEPSAHRRYNEEQERSLNIEFRARAATRHARVPLREDLAGWLSLGQHFGLPTRLLDWSFSPLIAAYFATLGELEAEEGATIWALAPAALNVDFGFEPYLYPLDAASIRQLLEPAFAPREESPQIVAAAMAIETEPRMQMQQGAFTVHGLRQPLETLPNSSAWLYRADIPAQYISRLRCELRLLSIREDSVFPDLSALARQLARDVVSP